MIPLVKLQHGKAQRIPKYQLWGLSGLSWAEPLRPHQQNLISKSSLCSELVLQKKSREYVIILNPNQAMDVPSCPWHGEKTLWEQG